MSVATAERLAAPPAGAYAVLRDPAMLRARMLTGGLSQRSLARRARVSGGFVSHLLPPAHSPGTRPRRRYCTPDTADRLAAALGCATEVLFELRGAGDPSTGPLPVVRT